MAYGDRSGNGYQRGTVDAATAAIDLGRTGSPLPLVPETTHEVSGILDFLVRVTTPGTEVPLTATSTKVRYVTITAFENNTDSVVFGAATVVAALGAVGAQTRRGTPLAPGESASLPIDDLNKIYIDSVSAGDGVSGTALT